MSNKFKDCFTSKLPQYRYDIVIDGETFGTAHLLNAADQAYIESNSVTKKLVYGELVIDFNSIDSITCTLYRALDSWVLDASLNKTSIEDLRKELREAVFAEIQKHEAVQTQIVEDVEKN